MSTRPPGTVEVRTVAPDEVPVLAEISVAAYSSVPGFDPGEEYLTSLADVGRRASLATVLVAVDDAGRVVGGVTYVSGAGPYAEFDDASDAGMRMLAVAPHAQGRGVGTALVRACVARAEAEGRGRLWLHTTLHMAGAQRLYERLGFRRAPERDRALPDVALLAYVLDLQPAAPRRTTSYRQGR